MVRSAACVVAVAASLSAPLPAQPPGPDLVIRDVSVASTLPLADGQHLVTVSFRIENAGTADAAASQTRVSIGGIAGTYVTPPLQANTTKQPQVNTVEGAVQSAYVSHSLRTSQSEATVNIDLDVLQTVAESDEQNNSFQSTGPVHFDLSELNRWLSIGPATRPAVGEIFGVGVVTTLAIHPQNPDVVYAGARGSGLWKTEDAGQSWRPVTDALPLARADSVMIDPVNPDRVLMASTAGVFESTNGGAVWVQLTKENLQPTGAGFLAKGKGEILYLATFQGVKASQDGGHTWTTVLGAENPVLSLQLAASGSSLVAALSGPAGGSDAVGIFESVGDGLSPSLWHKLQGCPAAPLPAIPLIANVWAAQSAPQEWLSFRAKPPGCTKESCEIKELWKATSATCQVNGLPERNWQKVPLDSSCNTFVDNFSFLFLHPSAPSIVFKGGVPLCRSSSGGSPKALPGLHVDQHAIAVAPSNPAVMYVGNDGGVYRSDDSGATWRFAGEGLAVTEILALSPVRAAGQMLLAGSQDNGSLAWNRSSPVWATVDGGVRDVSAIVRDRRDGTFVYEVGSGLRDIFREQGSKEQSLSSKDLPPGAMYKAEPGPVLFGQIESTGASERPLVAAFQGLWLGPPWKQIDTSAGKGFNRVRLGPFGVWLAGTTDGRVFGGTDVKALKLLFQSPFPAAVSALAFASAQAFYVATNSGKPAGRIFRLDCQGAGDSLTCTSVDISPPQGFAGDVTAIGADPLAADTLLAALRENGVVRGTRSANTWTWSAYDNGLPRGVTATAIEAEPSGQIYLATFGRGAYFLHSAPLVVQANNSSVRGRVTSLEEERDNPEQPPGANNPLIVTATLDSKPGFFFSATNLSADSRNRLRNAFQKGTTVTIDFVVTSATSGRIIRVR